MHILHHASQHLQVRRRDTWNARLANISYEITRRSNIAESATGDAFANMNFAGETSGGCGRPSVGVSTTSDSYKKYETQR